MSHQCKKPKLRNRVDVISQPGLDAAALRNKAQAEPQQFVHLVRELTGLDPKTGDCYSGAELERQGNAHHVLSFSSIRDIRSLRDALDVEVEVKTKDASGRERAVSTSAFPLLTSALSVREVSQAYEAVPTVTQELVTDLDDNKKHTFIANVLTLDNDVERVGEAESFPHLGAGEEKFSIHHNRNGRQVAITQELIEENDVAGIVERLTSLGTIAMELQEEQGLKRVTDHDGSASSGAEPFALHINGTGVALFQTDNNPLSRCPATGNRVTNNALVDATDLENLRQRLAGMTNSRGKRIAIPRSELILLVPDALLDTADRLLGSELTPGVLNEVNPWGPRGRYRPKLISTPKLDDLSASAFYLGAFRRQFVRKWKLRPEIAIHSGTGTEMYVDARMAYRVRVAWDMEIGCRDYVYVIQSLSGTTAPKDES